MIESLAENKIKYARTNKLIIYYESPTLPQLLQSRR